MVFARMLGRPSLVGLLLAAGFLTACVRPKPENQVMKLGEDVLAAGSAPSLGDTISGDAILAGGEISFNGRTGGDYVGAGGAQDIRGRIHGSMRAAGGRIEVKAATIDRNATLVGMNISVDSFSVIGRNAYLVGVKIKIDGSVQGGLLATGADIEINGPIAGSVEVAGGALHLGPRAQITGDLTYRLREEVRIEPGAKIGGKITSLPVGKGKGLFTVLWSAGVVLSGVVAVLLLPGFFSRAAQRLTGSPVRSIVVGLLCAFLLPFALFLAAVTAVGLPLALIVGALLLVFVALSEVPVAVWIGAKILHNRTLLGRQSTVVNFFLGALVLLIIQVVPILGGVVNLVAVFIGLGAMLLAVWSARGEVPA
jgi:hypothetical protein